MLDYPTADGIKGILIYLLVYTFMNLGAFAVIASLRQRNVIGDEIDDIAGLFFRSPTEAVLMLVFLLSLAGIPPAGGLLRKVFYFLKSDRESALRPGLSRCALLSLRLVLLHANR